MYKANSLSSKLFVVVISALFVFTHCSTDWEVGFFFFFFFFFSFFFLPLHHQSVLNCDMIAVPVSDIGINVTF